MFYDKFVKLCDANSVSRSKACIDCGISRTAWHKWERGATPNGSTISKFAVYFGVTIDYLCGLSDEPYMHPVSPEHSLRGVPGGAEQLRRVSAESQRHRKDWDPDWGKKEAPTREGERDMNDDDLKAAFWGGEKDLSPEELDELWDDVREYAQYKAEQRRKKKQE